MSVCTHRYKNTPCGKPAQVLKSDIKYARLIEIHRCKFHDTLDPVGFYSEEEAWAVHITDLLTQEYNDYDD